MSFCGSDGRLPRGDEVLTVLRAYEFPPNTARAYLDSHGHSSVESVTLGLAPKVGVTKATEAAPNLARLLAWWFHGTGDR